MMKVQKSAFLIVFAVLVMLLTSCTRSRMAAAGRPVLHAEQCLHPPHARHLPQGEIAIKDVPAAADTPALATASQPVRSQPLRTVLTDRFREARTVLDPEVYREKAADLLRKRIAGCQDAEVSDVPGPGLSMFLVFLGFLACLIGSYIFLAIWDGDVLSYSLVAAGVLIGLIGAFRLIRRLRARWRSESIGLGPIGKAGLAVVLYTTLAFFLGMGLLLASFLIESEGLLMLSAAVIYLSVWVGVVGVLILLVGALSESY